MRALAAVAPGVRVVVIADACHAATTIRANAEDWQSTPKLGAKINEENRLQSEHDQVEGELVDKDMIGRFQDFRMVRSALGIPLGALAIAYHDRQHHYDTLAANSPTRDQQAMQTSVLWISACQPEETATEGQKHGIFTETLLEVWDDGKFSGGYVAIVQEISNRTNQKRQALTHGRFIQQTTLRTLGTADEAFLRKHRPFSVEPRRN